MTDEATAGEEEREKGRGEEGRACEGGWREGEDYGEKKQEGDTESQSPGRQTCSGDTRFKERPHETHQLVP